MAQQQLKHLKYDDKEIQVESAIRDGTGNVIANTYATKDEVSSGLAGKQATLTAGTGIDITSNTVSVTKATSSALGGIKLGTGLSMDTDGIVSVSSAGSVDWVNVSSKPFSSVSTGTSGDFVVSNNVLSISTDKFATKTYVGDNFVSTSIYETFVNTTLPANYQAKLPTTSTAGKALISTSTSGTVKWSDWSTAGLLKTNASGVISVDTTAYITNAVDNLTNYYKKSETYTKSEIGTLINGLHQFEYVVADSLPTASASTMYKIYLIPAGTTSTNNIKNEFITVRSGSEGSYTYSWEQIGSTAVDLSSYVSNDSSLTNGYLPFVDTTGKKLKGSGLTFGQSTSSSNVTTYIFKAGNPEDGNIINFDASGLILHASTSTGICVYTSNLWAVGGCDLGKSGYQFGDLYLSGGLRDGKNANYELTLPDTTSWTANKTIATTDQIPTQHLSATDVTLNY